MANSRNSSREQALVDQALAEVRTARRAATAEPAFDPDKTIPVALLPESERPAWAPRPPAQPPEVPPQALSASAAEAPAAPALPLERPAPQASARGTVFAPANMSPEMQAKIALLMEQEAEAREARRKRQKRVVTVAASVGVLALVAVFLLSLGTPGSKKPKAVQLQDQDFFSRPIA